MTSGQDLSEYLDTLGLFNHIFPSFFEKKKLKKLEKKNVFVLRRPEDEVISLFEGLLADPDVSLRHV